jgi:hypothetical protein
MHSLSGSLGRASRNPLVVATATSRPILRNYRIEGRVVWDDDGFASRRADAGLGWHRSQNRCRWPVRDRRGEKMNFLNRRLDAFRLVT